MRNGHLMRCSAQRLASGSLCLIVLVSLVACGGGSGSSVPATTSGTNTITGTMPPSATISLEGTSQQPSIFAQLLWFLSGPEAVFAASKGRVTVDGTTIQALPVGGGRFELVGVPDGMVTIHVTTPDGVTGTLTLTLPQGGGALVDLGTVTVHRNGQVEFSPPLSPALLPAGVKARGTVSGLAAAATAKPSEGSCSTFIVAGLMFCFDQTTWFDPPLSATTPSANGQNVEVTGIPTSDKSSTTFRALRVQQNSGVSAAVQNTIKVVGPITSAGVGTLTVFGGTTAAPDAHAITFTMTQTQFDPPALQNDLAVGLLVEVSGGPVSTESTTGKQSDAAMRVKLVRLPIEPPHGGEIMTVKGTVSSIQVQAKTFGLNNDTRFVQVMDHVTRFDDPLTSFGDIRVGEVLEVTGLPPRTVGGPIRALDVEREASARGAAIQAQGTISALNTTASTFVVAGITFCYNCNNVTTQFKNVTAQSLVNGQFVEVMGTALSGGVSTALVVEQEPAPSFSSTSDKSGTDDQT